MAEFLHFSRVSRMFIVAGTGADTRAWSCPVLDGFSFSQATNASEITLGEMEDASGRSRRGRKMFTDSLSAAEFSFSTYVRPFRSLGGGGATQTNGRADDTSGAVHAVEEILWAHMAGRGVYVPASGTYTMDATTGGAITELGTVSASSPANTVDGTYNIGVSHSNPYKGQQAGSTSTYARVIRNQHETVTLSTGSTTVSGINTGTTDLIKAGDIVEKVSGTGTVAAGTTVVSVSSGSVVLSANPTGSGSTVVRFVNPLAANASIKVVVTNSSGTPAFAVTVTERGIGFFTGDKIDIDANGFRNTGTTGTGRIFIPITSQSVKVQSGTTLGVDDSTDINFFDSNRSAIGEFDMYFVLSAGETGRLVYRLKDAVVNEASVDFDIDGIATINWSGMAGQIIDVSPDAATGAQSANGNVTASASPANATVVKNSATSVGGSIWLDSDADDRLYVAVGTASPGVVGTHWIPAIDEGTGAADTGNFIRNRLTQITLEVDTDFNTSVSNRYETSYNIPITSGNITISNNITFLTPEELGKVNQPLRHVTGTRSVTGSVTCYLGSSDSADNRSKNLFEDLVGDINTIINKFALTFDIGGKTTKPRLQFKMPVCHLEVPSHSIDDVISLETNFHGLGSTIGESDEVTLKYFGA